MLDLFVHLYSYIPRFEEEIGMPYIPADVENRHAAAGQHFVLGTNTFNQAQRNLIHMNHDGTPDTTMFVPNQVLNRPQTLTAQGNLGSTLYDISPISFVEFYI